MTAPTDLSISSAVSAGDILVVDDTINNLRLLSGMLSKSGYSVRKALNGTMALTAVRASQPDLILLDVNMPDIDGYEVCRQLKQDAKTKEIPVIFISASNMTADKVKAFSIGGTDYITKPFHAEEVIARIRNQLLLSQLRSELANKNKQLENTLSELKAIQVEIIQKEKMLGLNQLIAGISHEINNPIGFIMGNLEPAQQYFFSLLKILDLYRCRYPDPGEDIEAAIAEADLDFIIRDFSSVLKSMEKGTTRICDIVSALSTFSYRGSTSAKPIDLHTTLDSILVLLKPKLRGQGNRPSIRLRCTFCDSLPLVTCEPGLMSQAILHILDNAIDAINVRWENTATLQLSDQASLQEPEIIITTGAPLPNLICISIRDNGIGIAEGIKPRVYEPFFTTKSIGEGHGLGLSISYQIIVGKHQGSLCFTSQPSLGTEFTIQIPTQATVIG